MSLFLNPSRFLVRVAGVARPLATSASTKPQSDGVNDVPEMPPCDVTPEKYQGSSIDHHKAVRGGMQIPGPVMCYSEPLIITQGHKQWMWDHTGRRYLDLLGGICTVSVGHCHPRTVAALTDQSKRLWHMSALYMNPTVTEYVEKLTSKMPGNLKCVYLVNSGSEANDLALMMARLYTGAFDIISLRSSYHGASPHLQGLTALSTWRYNVPSGFGMQQTMNPDVYQGVWGGARCRDSPIQTTRTCSCAEGECQASVNYAQQVADVLQYSMPKKRVAGFFAESIQGVAGSVQFPKGFLKKAFELVRERGGVCISDEVQTGFARTGEHYWGFQGHGVMPDIVTMAKGIGNGFPLAAVVTSPEVAGAMSQALHFNTYGGNPLACAVGSVVLDIIDDEDIQENCDVVGTYCLHELAKLRDEFKIVGDVRGKGLMIGVEFVTDKESRTPLPPEKMNAIFESTKDCGVLFGRGGLRSNVIRLKPPMCITKPDVDFAVAVLRKAIQDHV